MRIPVVTNDASAGDGPYSQGVKAGGFVFISGQGPLDPATGEIRGTGIAEQAELTLRNVLHIAAAAGCSVDDIVKVTVFLADLRDFQAFNEVYQQFFDKPMPARTCVESGLDGILVEIDAIGLIPAGQSSVAQP